MMVSIKQALFTGWNFMRFLRLAFGIFFIVQGIQSHDNLTGFVGAFFLLTAVTNVGCCGGGNCNVSTTGKTLRDTDEIEYEEIGNK